MKIINCIIVDDEPTARDILQILLEKLGGVQIIASCKNAKEANEVIHTNTVDLIFLDIHMPDMSGITLAKIIPKSCKIIFTTAFREYAVEGFDLQAVDYLLKPIALERLSQAILKYRSESTLIPLEKVNSKNYITIRSERKMIKLNWSDLIFIESLGDYLKIHTTSKTIITRETISGIESKLPTDDFIRIHRSFIISISYIQSYNHNHVEIHGKTLPISRSFKKQFLNQMEK